jgi:3-dehydroquinate synthase
MKCRTIFASCGKEYPIYLGSKLHHLIDFKKNKLVLIMDSNLAKIYGKKFLEFLSPNLELFLKVPAGEASKTREVKQILEDKLLAKNCGRDIMILAVGGGMICDLVGFLAATYCRGVPVVYWPTSLLAMVDASIGGKTAVNTPFGKNLIGAFSTPFSVWMDVSYLETLPAPEFANGMVEVIKHAFIYDKDFFERLLYRHLDIIQLKESTLVDIIEKSCLIKNGIVSQDVYDLGVRSILNFGHTIGHAIEQLEKYQIKHGEAVAIGMIIETYISHLKGIAPIELIDELKEIFKLYHLDLKTSVLKYPSGLLKCLYADKKNKNQKVHMVLIEDIGQVYCEEGFYTHPIEETLIKKALSWAKGQF